MNTVQDLVRVAKATSDPTRLKLLVVLSRRELCVCELVHLVDVGQPAVSRHLGILKDAGLVEDYRDGQYVNYRLKRPARTPFAEMVVNGILGSCRDAPELEPLLAAARVVDRCCL